jgi:hypothetical protein
MNYSSGSCGYGLVAENPNPTTARIRSMQCTVHYKHCNNDAIRMPLSHLHPATYAHACPPRWCRVRERVGQYLLAGIMPNNGITGTYVCS